MTIPLLVSPQAAKAKSPVPKFREAGEGDDGGNYKKAETVLTKEEEEVITFGGKKAKEKKVNIFSALPRCLFGARCPPPPHHTHTHTHTHTHHLRPPV
jgi:hypothetical protein